ncbi:serine/threonine protein kinase [Methylocaldum marinum]|uniref:Stress response kinase A n=1 Tax=Methylocaldum marinum TaxID=1432792 RepID=A0A250KM04_9GAMM|nr:serine/threonine protein kinase [Methylocaldum marinum]BBA32586.1 serine/threonine protein kinase [Methylocaldum marinum]
MNTLVDRHPFSSLKPDLVMNAMESAGFASDGSLLALHSYENRVYRIGLEDGAPVVVKFYRPGRWSNAAIFEEHAFVRELAESELPVVPALQGSDGSTLHEFGGFRFAVFPSQGGHAPEFSDYGTLARMGRLIARMHAVGALKSFRERPALDIASFGEEPRDYLLLHDVIPADIADAYRNTVNQALDGVKRCFERAGAVRSLRLHGDCYPGNMLWTDDGPHFVDFDDSRMGPAIQDLWMLLSGDRSEMTQQLSHLLSGYRSFHEFDPRELYLIEALRSLRLIHYTAWIARRWSDPAFPIAFPWFDTPRYWHDRILELREQIAAMDEPPLCPA